jgi:hypothetical protein
MELECIGDAYGDCEALATWVRCTQFAGDHPLCQKHAEEDDQFLVNNSYQVWIPVKNYRSRSSSSANRVA